MITSFLFSMLSYCVLLSPLYILIRYFIVKNTGFNWLKELWYFSFFLYSVCILSQTVLPSREFLMGIESYGGRSNYKPFVTIVNYVNELGGPSHTIAFYNLAGNVLLFIPFGFYIPSIWKSFQRWWKMVVSALCIPVSIESTQYFIGRSVDIDDIILNTFAIVLGYLLFIGYKWVFIK